MKPADVCTAVLVAVIWGLAFVASRIALNEFSPELMTTLRFAIAAVPCLFVRKPDVSWPLLITISFTLFLGQFLAQAIAIARGVPVGLTSVIVQSQALFTIGFAALLFRERPTRMQTVGIAIATLGLLMICGTVGYDFSVGAFAVLMISPVSFAIGNLLLRRAQGGRMFDLFAWLCLAAAVPLLALTLVTNGPQPTWHALTQMSLTGLVCMLGLGGISTSIAYWLWGRLLRDYAAAQVVPFALLVPFVGSAASSIVFGETFGPLRLAGMVTVVGGIAVMLLSKRAVSRAEDRVSPNMSHSLLIALVVFGAVMAFTPGPNNVMVLSSGLTYGFRRSLPHIAGIAIGVSFMVAAVGVGLGAIFIAYPVLQIDSEIRRRRLSDLPRLRDRAVRVG